MNGDQEELTGQQRDDLHVLLELWGPGWDLITDEAREQVTEMLGHGQRAA